MAKQSERKNRSARERMRAEEKELDEKYTAMKVEHQKWLNIKGVLQIVFVIVMSLSMWIAGKYCENVETVNSVFVLIVMAYAVLTVVTKWRAIDYWDADMNQIANGRVFACMTLVSAMVAFLQ